MATAIMPYTIGQTNILFVEEFNISFDSGTCVGIAEITGSRFRTVLDSTTVRGMIRVRDAQQYSSAGFLVTAIGNAFVLSVDGGKVSSDLGRVTGIADVLYSRSGYVGICRGVAILSSEGGDPDSIALQTSVEASGALGLTRNLRTRNVPGEEVTDDVGKSSWQFAALLIEESLNHGLYSDVAGRAGSDGAEFYRERGLDNVLFLSSGEFVSNIAGKTRFGGAESSVAINAVLVDEGFAVGVSSGGGFSVTLDDYWLNGIQEVDGAITNFEPRTYITIPKQNRLVVGAAQPYSSNYETIGVGEPNLNNTPIFTSYLAYGTVPPDPGKMPSIAQRIDAVLADNSLTEEEKTRTVESLRTLPQYAISDFSEGGNMLGGSETYEESFLRVDMYTGATVSHKTFTIDESGLCIGKALVQGDDETAFGDYTRYGGQGVPPGIYSTGVYAQPRGSVPDDLITNGITEVSTTGSTTTFTTSTEHRFVPGDTVAMSGIGAGYDTSTGWLITATPTPTTFTVLDIPGAGGTLVDVVGVVKSKTYFNRVLGGYVIGAAQIQKMGATGPTGPSGATLSV